MDTMIVDAEELSDLLAAAAKSHRMLQLVEQMYRSGVLVMQCPPEAEGASSQEFIEQFEVGLSGCIEELEEAEATFEPDDEL
ncbi:MAG: hypothetical protein EOL87_10250 [Spartobacteria bacterium]|nr:hypothetical protein [Spartobacteria bacterium]